MIYFLKANLIFFNFIACKIIAEKVQNTSTLENDIISYLPNKYLSINNQYINNIEYKNQSLQNNIIDKNTQKVYDTKISDNFLNKFNEKIKKMNELESIKKINLENSNILQNAELKS